MTQMLTGVVVLSAFTAMSPVSPASADAVVATITVGDFPWGVAINPGGTFAYVTNEVSGTVSKINLATDTVVATITVGDRPMGVAINPAGTFAYVTNRGYVNRGMVYKINLATDTVVATINVGGNPERLTIDPTGTFAYIANSSSGMISKLNLATDMVDATISFGSFPYALAINPAGTFAYVISGVSGSVVGWVSKLNLTTGVVDAKIKLPDSPGGVAINPAGTFAYVTNYKTGDIYKIDLATDTLVATINVGKAWSFSVAINPAGTFAYVTSSGKPYSGVLGWVSKIDLTSDTVESAISFNGGPIEVVINPAGTFAYVTSDIAGTVSKIELTPAALAVTKRASGKSLAKAANLPVPNGATISLRVTPASAKFCKVSGTTLKVIKTGSCQVTVTVKPKGGNPVSRTLTLVVTK